MVYVVVKIDSKDLLKINSAVGILGYEETMSYPDEEFEEMMEYKNKMRR